MAPSRHDLLGAREELQALVLCRNLAGKVLNKLGEIRQGCGMPLDEQSGDGTEIGRQGVGKLCETSLKSSGVHGVGTGRGALRHSLMIRWRSRIRGADWDDERCGLRQ